MAVDNPDVIDGTIVPKEPPGRRRKVITWLRRIGLAGFAFFLFKGLVWLFFEAALVKYFGCNQ